MPNDLQVAGIQIPNVVVAACPSTVTVDVINVGNTPASLAKPMTVCLDIHTSPEGPPAAHLSVETPPESPPILPGNVQTFTFSDVQFPCALTAFVKATADCKGTVPNNVRTAPTLEIFVPKIDAVPWLWTSLVVGLEDSTGTITWSPGGLCAGGKCVAKVSIRNAGCAVAVASVTTLELLDGAGASIALLKQNTPPILPGATSVVQFTTVLPSAAAGNRIKVIGCADSKGVVTPQCNLVHACDQVTLPLSTTSTAPKVTFSASRPIFPGEAVPIRGGCRTSAQTSARSPRRFVQGTVVYTSTQIPVGLQAADGEDVDIGPIAAPSFYKEGVSKLTIEIKGTGTDQGRTRRRPLSP